MCRCAAGILLLPICFVAACGRTEYVYVTPEVPGQLLAPTPISERVPGTARELAIVALDWRESAEQANADKAAIYEILQAARGEE